jgi:hypothetical protein
MEFTSFLFGFLTAIMMGVTLATMQNNDRDL